MKTKLEMAHDYLIKLIEVAPDESTRSGLVSTAWNYADLMQAEADKRENKTRPEVLMAVQQTFINGIEQPRYATSMGDQKRTPKVSRFERSDAVKEVLDRAENMGLIKPKAINDWQPDWSQAPEWYSWWAMDEDRKCHWFSKEPNLVDGFSEWILGNNGEGLNNTYSPSIHCDYKGDWRYSLRKRPN